MGDNLLDNYNPLYDIHLRQYFALPHMQKHLQKMGLLESTLNLNGDEVYARHHAMMDMMLKNREAQLVKMAEIRKKLDAAEKVELCRRIRTGQSPESYRRGKPSRSLSRSRANQKGGRQRRFSNSYEDRDFVQNIEERNADPEDYDTKDPYKRLSANAKRFNYLHKLDDKTLIAYKDNLKQQLQRLERFREISFGPHSVARQPPPPQASWFFRRRSLPSLTASAPGNTLKEPLRSVLNMRGRKTTAGNKLNASHDSRTSCPPTTRKRKDSNTRLPPINPKGRVSSKPPAPMSLQQTSTKLPPAARKPAPTRGRPSNKRQTTTTTTTTITAVSKSPPTPVSLPTLPVITGHGIFTGAAAAATAAVVGTAAISVENLISDEPKTSPTQTPPISPVLETQKTFDRSSPVDQIPAEVLETLANDSEQKDEVNDDHVEREIVFDNAPIDHSHGDYVDSDSEPEYAEEDREPSPENAFSPHNVQITETAATPLVIDAEQISSPISDKIEETETVVNQSSLSNSDEALPDFKDTELSEKQETTLFDSHASKPSSPVYSEQEEIMTKSMISHSETQNAPESPTSPIQEEEAITESHEMKQEEKEDEEEEHVVHQHHEELHSQNAPSDEENSVHADEDNFEKPNEEPAVSITVAEEHAEFQQSPELFVHSSQVAEHFDDHDAVPQSPVLSVHGVDQHEDVVMQSPVLSVHSDEHENQEQTTVHEIETAQSPLEQLNEPIQQTVSHSNVSSTSLEENVDAPVSPTPSADSSHSNERAEPTDSSSHSPSHPAQHVVESTDYSTQDDSHDYQNSDETVLTHIEQTTEERSHSFSESQEQMEHSILPEPTHEDSSPEIQSELEKDSFVPRSPSVHTSDASDNGSEVGENHEEQQVNSYDNDEHQVSEHASELYNPSNGNMDSPALSDNEQDVVIVNPASPKTQEIPFSEQEFGISQEEGMTIADRIDMEAYHNSPTKESTSPVAPNPVQTHITAEEVTKQLASPDESSFSNFASEPADTFEQLEKPTEEMVHSPEAYELSYDKNGEEHVDAMTTSVYHSPSDHGGSQSSLDALPEVTTKIKEWDNGDEHVKETVTRSEFTVGDTHQSYSETVTVITDKSNTESDSVSPVAMNLGSPNGNSADNISTDSLVIHDEHMTDDQQMTQSVYEPKEEIEEKEWDEGNSHVHEIISNVEHTDETGRHFTETVTTTTTVIKSGDDLKNNNDEGDDEHDDDESTKSSVEGERELLGSNGNSTKETITTSTVVTRSLPDGGILVDDGDETNTSSL